MILSTSISQIKKAVKSLIININDLEIESNKKDYTILDVKNIIPLL